MITSSFTSQRMFVPWISSCTASPSPANAVEFVSRQRSTGRRPKITGFFSLSNVEIIIHLFYYDHFTRLQKRLPVGQAVDIDAARHRHPVVVGALPEEGVDAARVLALRPGFDLLSQQGVHIQADLRIAREFHAD